MDKFIQVTEKTGKNIKVFEWLGFDAGETAEVLISVMEGSI